MRYNPVRTWGCCISYKTTKKGNERLLTRFLLPTHPSPIVHGPNVQSAGGCKGRLKPSSTVKEVSKINHHLNYSLANFRGNGWFSHCQIGPHSSTMTFNTKSTCLRGTTSWTTECLDFDPQKWADEVIDPNTTHAGVLRSISVSLLVTTENTTHMRKRVPYILPHN
jgi:hypothetical protein